MNPLLKLQQYGQSYWVDNLSRKMIMGGDLKRRVTDRGLRGVTSNPAIFEKAITGSRDYDEQIESLVLNDCSTQEIYESLVTSDVRNACDVLRRVYDESEGADGYVSLEVSPHLAHDTKGSIDEAKRLYALVNRPNLFIKIPATLAGLSAIEELLVAGIPVNITLLFSIERYEAVAEAYLRALERRAAMGRDLREVASVASFFLSRIDALIDELLAHRMGPNSGDKPQALQGKVAIANAKLAYQRFKEISESERWKTLAKKGARVQRLLWASTSTKSPRYGDVMYVEPLIGRDTVNTMPEKTIAAFADHGCAKATVEEDIAQARQVLDDLNALGIDLRQVTEQLLNEGIQKFIAPYDKLMSTLASRCQQYRDREHVAPLKNMAKRLRRQVLRMTTQAGSGHPTSCMSCAEIVAALFFHEMRWDPNDPKARNVDTFILSKGHAAPILWASLSEAGAIAEDPLSLRQIDSSLEGHPTPNNAWVKVATGSLGQGLAAANGIALANRLDGINARAFVLLGDGECSEGSVWEAAQFASLQKLKNVIAIVDVNALGQSGSAPYCHDTAVFVRRFESFGWKVNEIDGHDIPAILAAFAAAKKDGPTAIIARTEKGKGVSFLEGEHGWHGKALDEKKLKQALQEIGEVVAPMQVAPRRLGEKAKTRRENPERIALEEYKAGDQVATRTAFGAALRKLGELCHDIVVLDGDVKNSTGTDEFAEAIPERFFQSYIAEQNMVGTALGLAVSGKIPIAASFACFLTRAADFIRMAGHSHPPQLIFCGSHSGVSIGEDGPSQMGLEDLALFRAVQGSTVLCPCDAVSAERLTEEAVKTPGIVYLRTLRPKTPVIYSVTETFLVGGSKMLKSSERDAVTLVAAGITVHEALAAHESLRAHGISARVIDAYSVKPLDADALARAARETRLLVVIEDHFAEGGLGEAVTASVGSTAPVHHLAVTGHPRSGTKDELLARHRIDRDAIVAAVLKITRDKSGTSA
ncbi:MAG: transketolase [Burkholderiales bacterium]